MNPFDDPKPGSLSVRLGFIRNMNTHAISPTLEITDQMSRLILRVELTAKQLVDMLSGSEARVSAENVDGSAGLPNWGKRQVTSIRTVKVQLSDRNIDDAIRDAPHIASVIAEMEGEGFAVNPPRRNNNMQWVLTGRRYDDV